MKIKRLALLVSLTTVTACASPLQPTPTAPPDTVTLSMTVMGNNTKLPLVGVSTRLLGGAAQLTDAEGKARWTVEAGHSYAISVCGESASAHLVTGPGEVGWLISLPEAVCGR